MSRPLPMMNDDELRARDRAGQPADGFGCLETTRGRLPLTAMKVDTAIGGLLAESRVEQTFANAFDEPIEATYIFPLPHRAAVVRCELRLGERVIAAVLEERGAARERYARAIEEGQRAAIAEEERPDVFTLRVGNIDPGEQALVQLTLVGPLPREEGEVTFRWPLVVAPRYIPGVALDGGSVGEGVAADTDAVPDASRISPPVLLEGFPNPVRLSISVAIDTGGLELSGLRSSLHTVEREPTASGAGRRYRVELTPGQRLDRDLIIRYQLASEQLQSAAQLCRDPGAESGTFMVTLVPPRDTGPARRGRDIVFVLDRSGSMGGWKMVAARRAVARMVDTLGEKDRFNVFAFDNALETPAGFDPHELTAASDRQRFRAVEFLAALEGRGGTELSGPLNTAAELLAGGYADRHRAIVVVTDGQVGNEEQILRRLQPRLRNVRIFTLGVDRAVNASFLQRLAALGAGHCDLVESEDRLDEVMDAIHRRLGQPLVTELALAAEGLELEPGTTVPARIPDLFAGAPLTLLGRFRRVDGTPTFSLAGRHADGTPWCEKRSARSSDGDALTAVWARGQLRQLEDRYATARDEEQRRSLERQIVDTSLAFNVLCRFTAFVAVDRQQRAKRGAPPRRVIQPVESPSGWQRPADDGPLFDGDGFVELCAVPAPEAVERGAHLLHGVARIAEEARARVSGGTAARGAPDRQQRRTLQNLGRLIGGDERRERRRKRRRRRRTPRPRPTVDWTAYRERARQLLDRLDAGDRAGALGVLLAALLQLLEDLSSVGAPAEVRDPLEQLTGRLRRTLGGADDGEPLDRLHEEARAVLERFAAPPSRGRDRGRTFWK